MNFLSVRVPTSNFKMEKSTCSLEAWVPPGTRGDQVITRFTWFGYNTWWTGTLFFCYHQLCCKKNQLLNLPLPRHWQWHGYLSKWQNHLLLGAEGQRCSRYQPNLTSLLYLFLYHVHGYCIFFFSTPAQPHLFFSWFLSSLYRAPCKNSALLLLLDPLVSAGKF